ncbi:hypothetical protein [Paenarthrobacter sp. 2TAF44]|uniref:hypothetical protein n=1 Tax=Paenarthrobacter sp. 2TAF44 TaxID=3233018 RepID=UPI003F96139E
MQLAYRRSSAATTGVNFGGPFHHILAVIVPETPVVPADVKGKRPGLAGLQKITTMGRRGD